MKMQKEAKRRLLFIVIAITIFFCLGIWASLFEATPNKEYFSIEYLTPETIKVTGYTYKAIEKLRQKYIIINIKPVYANPRMPLVATEYIITVKPKASSEGAEP